MCLRPLWGVPACLLALCAVGADAGRDGGPADEELLKAQGVPADGPGLLQFFKKRARQGASPRRIKELIRQLGDDSFEKREEASRELLGLGPRARAHLKEALKDPDLEIRKRAERCLKGIASGAEDSTRVSAAAVRVLARLNPPGAAGALLTFLPAAENDAVAEEVRDALAALAARAGKADPALVGGLKDEEPVRRAAAGVALCRARVKGQLPAVRKLLADPEPGVRLRVALALAERKEKDALPVLVELLGAPPSREGRLAEELLYRLAGDKAPAPPEGEDAAARRKLRRDWRAWWKGHGEAVDADRLGRVARTAGHTAVLLLDDNRALGLDASNRVLWEFGGLQKPLDVQWLEGGRVLVAEHDGNRVTERNHKGEVVWEKKVTGPLAAQRLPNGNTFVATQEGVFEYDRAGKQVSEYYRPAGERIMRACKLPDGDLALVTQLGVVRFVRVGRDGKDRKGFGVEVQTSGGRIDVTPAGHALVPELGNNRVVERDADGKVVREVSVEGPIAAVYLPNGHLLVTSMARKRAVEFDRDGKEVWEYRRDTRVTRAVRR
jgi:hypothetical protein